MPSNGMYHDHVLKKTIYYWPPQQKSVIKEFCLLPSRPGLGLLLFFTVTCCLLVAQGFTLFSKFALLLCLHSWLSCLYVISDT